MKSTLKLATVALAVLALAGCGAGTTNPGATNEPLQPTESSPPLPAADSLGTRYPVTVLDDGDGAELCFGVRESYPPQCGGPSIVGWDWADYEGTYQEASGVKWGEYTLMGSYDPEANTFTPTNVTEASEFDWSNHTTLPDFTSPCPEPEGGWRVLDPALTTSATLEQTIGIANELPDLVSVWVDTSRNPDAQTGPELDNPESLILNVKVTGDVAAAETKLRGTWGGMLCVSTGARSMADAVAIQQELNPQVVPGMLSSGVGIDGIVNLEVMYDDGTLQQQLDAKYGAGAVVVTSALIPMVEG